MEHEGISEVDRFHAFERQKGKVNIIQYSLTRLQVNIKVFED